MSKPKSKGRVTYHTSRRIGEDQPREYALTATTDLEMELLKEHVEASEYLELVRVEITPV